METDQIDVLYWQTHGPDELLAYSAFVMAMDERGNNPNNTVAIYFYGPGINLVRKGIAEAVEKQETAPMSLSQFRDAALNMGVRYYVCEATKQFMGLKGDGDFIEGVRIAGVTTLNDLLKTTKYQHSV